MAGERKAAKVAAEALAHLYVWGAVIDIMEGGASPDRGDISADADVRRVVAIARKQTQRLLKIHDKAMEKLP
jgi:hypothetical protein